MGNHHESVLRLWSTPSVASARGFITPSSPYLRWALGPPLPGVMDSFLVPFVFVEHARVDVPTLYPTLRDASCVAICTVTVGNPFFLVNTRSLVSGYRWSSCPGGPAPWYCTPSWAARSVRSAFEKSWPCLGPPRLYFSVFGEPSLSRFPRVGSACTVLLHPSLAGTLLPPRLAPYCPSQ